MQTLLLVATGGALGSLGRHTLTLLVFRMAGAPTPLGTFVVNMLGCLFFGTVWGALEHKIAMGPSLRLFLLSGFMGAFTTFSTFIFESLNLLHTSQWAYVTCNLVGQVILGLLLLAAGMAVGKML